ncbi:MAG TPA: phosphoribosylaminoimidazolesuccinocarboxamide synthase [Longimicrobiales bacterium]
MNNPIAVTELPFPLVRRGKVRDVYDVGAGRLLIVATDRISAFDVVMPQPIPDKGAVLTQITAWWLSQGGPFWPNHLISADSAEIAKQLPEIAEDMDIWQNRAMLVKKTEPIPFECVVRGYISGSAWKEYQESGTLAGEALPAGLTESVQLSLPIFSPATKAAEGHDENVTFDRMMTVLGARHAEDLRERSIGIYRDAERVAERVGIIIADTKFEFGQLNGDLLLIDEVLTPDSSRFWPRETYMPGRGQPSLDKQPVRDYLETLVAQGKWHKQPPGPELPRDVIAATTQRYRELYRRMTGKELS